MNNRVLVNNLYDYYGELLTETQRKYFEYYYFDNLSLGEIANNMGLSRNAIHLAIKTAVKHLREYEEKLGLYARSKKIDKLIKDADEKTKEMLENLR